MIVKVEIRFEDFLYNFPNKKNKVCKKDADRAKAIKKLPNWLNITDPHYSFPIYL